MRHFMIDIEGMSTHERNAVILSVAIVEFKMTIEEPHFLGNNVFFPMIETQLFLGRIVSDDTQRWWREQSDQARDASISTVRCELFQLCQGLLSIGGGEEEKNVTVWADCMCYDFGNLVDLCDKVIGKRPWRYSAAHDVHTLKYFPAKRIKPPHVIECLDLHNPVDDCIKQVWDLWELWDFEDGSA